MRPPLVRLSAAAAQPSEVLEADGPPSEPRGSAIVSTRPQPRSDLALSAHRCVPLAFRMPRLRCVQLVHAWHAARPTAEQRSHRRTAQRCDAQSPPQLPARPQGALQYICSPS